MNPVIEAHHLSKKYRLGEAQPYYSLRDKLAQFFDKPKIKNTEFWALKDVSFQIPAGQALGVIGPNGSGKSTLLKILSRITPPTSGHAVLRGRIASLLEVGTGFNPELTGKDNIFLNGAILGMAISEIKSKFHAIVDFSGVEKFIDTPVKHYSSGMYVRLAFAVAAFLDPEILLIDEVLSVGDAEFQKKCLRQMDDITKSGRTIIFVSHNLTAVEALCPQAILLRDGKIAAFSTSSAVIKEYLKITNNTTHYQVSFNNRQGLGHTKITGVTLSKKIATGEPLAITVKYTSLNQLPLKNCRLGINFFDATGQYLFLLASEVATSSSLNLPPSGTIECQIPRLPLSSGFYSVDLFFEVNGLVQDWVKQAISLKVNSGRFYPFLRQYPAGYEGKGVLIDHAWKVL